MYRIASGAGRLACGAAAVAGTLVFFACTASLGAQAPATPAPAQTAPPLAPAAPQNPAPAPAAPAPAGTLVTTPCGNALGMPPALPPPGSAPFLWILEPCFDKQGGASTVETETYMYYIKIRPSVTSQGVFVSMDEAAEQTMRADFKALWATNFLEDLSIELTDTPSRTAPSA